MDRICSSYSNASDDDSDSKTPIFPPLKRPRPEYPYMVTKPQSSTRLIQPEPGIQNVAPNPGRYISKRERLLAASNLPSNPDPDPMIAPKVSTLTSQVLGSISISGLPHHILSSLKHHPRGHAQQGRISGKLSASLCNHTKAVNAIHWSQSHAHLLASAGMDHKICIWNVWSRDQKLACVFNFHKAAVKDVQWSPQGLSVLSCGFDCLSRLVDIEKGTEMQNFKEKQAIRVVKFHPENCNLFLSGGSKGSLKLWDIRSGKVAHEYVRDLGPILDVEFSIDGRQFISSSDVSGVNMSENSIIVWDVAREVPLSNQVYVEAYTCPCIRQHPFEPYFVAQSNGNYIAIFSSSPPFRLNKYKRYESHSVLGFPVKCDFSRDGKKIVSGSSDGFIYVYNSRTSELESKIKAYEQACIDVAFHPVMPNVIASCSWNGDISVYE